MATSFFDTSGLFRRYDPFESGAARVRALCRPSRRNAIIVARLTSTEMASVLARKVREGRLSSAECDRMWRLFGRHWRVQYQVITATDEVHQRAERLLFTYALRSLDALQLASALTAQATLQHTALQFWTADQRQAGAAEAEGLTVEFLS